MISTIPRHPPKRLHTEGTSTCRTHVHPSTNFPRQRRLYRWHRKRKPEKVIAQEGLILLI